MAIATSSTACSSNSRKAKSRSVAEHDHHADAEVVGADGGDVVPRLPAGPASSPLRPAAWRYACCFSERLAGRTGRVCGDPTSGPSPPRPRAQRPPRRGRAQAVAVESREDDGDAHLEGAGRGAGSPAVKSPSRPCLPIFPVPPLAHKRLLFMRPFSWSSFWIWHHYSLPYQHYASHSKHKDKTSSNIRKCFRNFNGRAARCIRCS